ncbi:MAG: hypothetical protein KTR25_06565 [Myxococcales bacterium]|nr:hypothetical protein [Myxococcales bacterium]
MSLACAKSARISSELESIFSEVLRLLAMASHSLKLKFQAFEVIHDSSSRSS